MGKKNAAQRERNLSPFSKWQLQDNRKMNYLYYKRARSMEETRRKKEEAEEEVATERSQRQSMEEARSSSVGRRAALEDWLKPEKEAKEGNGHIKEEARMWPKPNRQPPPPRGEPPMAEKLPQEQQPKPSTQLGSWKAKLASDDGDYDWARRRYRPPERQQAIEKAVYQHRTSTAEGEMQSEVEATRSAEEKEENENAVQSRPEDSSKEMREKQVASPGGPRSGDGGDEAKQSPKGKDGEVGSEDERPKAEAGGSMDMYPPGLEPVSKAGQRKMKQEAMRHADLVEAIDEALEETEQAPDQPGRQEISRTLTEFGVLITSKFQSKQSAKASTEQTKANDDAMQVVELQKPEAKDEGGSSSGAQEEGTSARGDTGGSEGTATSSGEAQTEAADGPKEQKEEDKEVRTISSWQAAAVGECCQQLELVQSQMSVGKVRQARKQPKATEEEQEAAHVEQAGMTQPSHWERKLQQARTAQPTSQQVETRQQARSPREDGGATLHMLQDVPEERLAEEGVEMPATRRQQEKRGASGSPPVSTSGTSSGACEGERSPEGAMSETNSRSSESSSSPAKVR